MKKFMQELAGYASLKEIARYVGCTPRAVSYWRAGKGNPREDHAQKLARLLHQLKKADCLGK